MELIVQDGSSDEQLGSQVLNELYTLRKDLDERVEELSSKQLCIEFKGGFESMLDSHFLMVLKNQSMKERISISKEKEKENSNYSFTRMIVGEQNVNQSEVSLLRDINQSM